MTAIHATPSQLQTDIANFVTNELAKILKVNPRDIEHNVAFDRYGVDSADAVELTASLGERFKLDLEATLLYDHPTIEALSSHVASLGAAAQPSALLTASPAA